MQQFSFRITTQLVIEVKYGTALHLVFIKSMYSCTLPWRNRVCLADSGTNVPPWVLKAWNVTLLCDRWCHRAPGQVNWLSCRCETQIWIILHWMQRRARVRQSCALAASKHVQRCNQLVPQVILPVTRNCCVRVDTWICAHRGSNCLQHKPKGQSS